MVCFNIIDIVFVGNSSCSAMIKLDITVSHITPNPSICSTPSSVFQAAINLNFCVQEFQTTSA